MQSMNRETALRIALATKALPGVEVGQLVEIINDKLDGDINEKKLTSITVTDIKNGFSNDGGDFYGDFDTAEIKQAVRILWGEKTSAGLPQASPLDTVPSRSVRVALASNTSESLDGHFGSCIRFLIFQVSDSVCQLIDVRSTIDADLAEDKNGFRAKLIDDCQVLYVVSIGGPAAAKVIATGVYPIKRTKGGMAGDILAQLQQVMGSAPPPWLAKCIGDKPEDRVRFMRAETCSDIAPGPDFSPIA